MWGYFTVLWPQFHSFYFSRNTLPPHPSMWNAFSPFCLLFTLSGIFWLPSKPPIHSQMSLPPGSLLWFPTVISPTLTPRSVVWVPVLLYTIFLPFFSDIVNKHLPGRKFWEQADLVLTLLSTQLLRYLTPGRWSVDVWWVDECRGGWIYWVPHNNNR